MDKLTVCGIFLAGVLPAIAADGPVCNSQNTIKADVVAIEHAFQYNRFGSFNPAGMIYALRHDVVPDGQDEAYFKLSVDQRLQYEHEAGKVHLRKDKRPRPLVLRVQEGDCLEVTFRNLMSAVPRIWPDKTVPEHALSPSDSTLEVPFNQVESAYPATRTASMHVNGLDYVDPPSQADGAYVGMNGDSLAPPYRNASDIRVYRWYGRKQGGYLLFSTAAPAGGEGDGGQVGLGLFGAVNVEPRGSVWYRSQVTNGTLLDAATGGDFTKIDYDKLKILGPGNRILHSDLNAIIHQERKNNQDPKDQKGEEYCPDVAPSTSCNVPFREFTVIFHDENTAVQAFAELEDETNPISSVKDGMGINYGISAMGPLVLANLKKIGPAAKCAECKFEEFFLASWANGDPALLPIYEDDPSNVHHSYLGDPVRFRNMHAGPKETHVFHLHAHQWLYDQRDRTSTYLDSQTISPGASYTYEIQYGGSGNKNLGVGDSIFHCHLYPHFAQGMWELWRSHDTLESGKKGVWNAEKCPDCRWLPDGEIADGTPNPAVVPIKGFALPPSPNKNFGGYPFYIAGRAGHRPPQAPLDLDWDEKTNQELNGGLGRHLVLEGETAAKDEKELFEARFGAVDKDAVALGAQISEYVARRTVDRNHLPALTMFDKKLVKATVHRLPREGTPAEQFAMQFHQGLADPSKLDFHGVTGPVAPSDNPGHHQSIRNWWPGMGYMSVRSGEGVAAKERFNVNGQLGRFGRKPGQALSKPGAPFSDPCPADPKMAVPLRKYRAAYVQFDLNVNKWGWHDPQARVAMLEEDLKDTLSGLRPAEPLFFRARSGECVQFAATNLIPSVLKLDDFQIQSPTDIIGQHIHLVKFDVTASDGSGNGWNYEDGTLAADEIRERVHAHNRANPGDPIALKTHPMFKTGAMAGDKRGWCADVKGGSDENPWCGAQTTVQRWYADPVLDLPPNDPKHPATDRTLRTVFTHDHFGPSSHQHHGLYAALVVEPKDSIWTTLDGTPFPSPARKDGGPTSYRANISVAATAQRGAYSRREYNMAFADFALLYNRDLEAINPPNRDELAHISGGSEHDLIPSPEGISGRDPGTQLINYRNEPIPLRISKEGALDQFAPRGPEDKRGMLQYAFSSKVHAPLDAELRVSDKSKSTNAKLATLSNAVEANRLGFLKHLDCRKSTPTLLMSFYCEWWRTDGDPSTPVLAAYEGDPVQLRLIQGAQEEQHVFSMTGVKWPFQTSDSWPKGKPNPGKDKDVDFKASGYVNSQHIGISEHMEFDTPLGAQGVDITDYLYMSSATDNLWDGMWGLLRAYGWKLGDKGGFVPNRPAKIKMVDLPDLKKVPVAAPRTEAQDICLPGTGEDITAAEAQKWLDANTVRFHVGAFLARDLLGPKGIVYNERAGLYDPNGIVFVDLDGVTPDASTVEGLKKLYLAGKPFEPLVLRAAAGACIEVKLKNYLHKRDLKEDEGHDDRYMASEVLREKLKGKTEDEIEEHMQRHRGSYSMMPQISEGFNINETLPSEQVGLTPQLVEFNMRNMSGVNIGLTDDAGPAEPCDFNSSVSCKEKRFMWYAGEHRFKVKGGKRVTFRVPMEFGAVSLRNLADPIKHSSHGAVGELIIEPEGSCFSYPKATGGDPSEIVKRVDGMTNAELTALRTELAGKGYCDAGPGKEKDMALESLRSKTTADIYRAGKKVLRDFAVIYQDDISLTQNGHPLPNLRGGDDAEDSSGKAFNYHSEPLWARVGAGSPEVTTEAMNERDFSNVLSSAANPNCGGPCGEPVVFTAEAGSEVVFRVVHPGGHPRMHGFAVFGHNWDDMPWKWAWNIKSDAWMQTMGDNHYSQKMGSVNGIGPTRHVNLRTCAGGAFAQPGDYLFRTQEAFQFQGGLWGIFRVAKGAGVCTVDADQLGAKK